jgi:hypothetical protein
MTRAAIAPAYEHAARRLMDPAPPHPFSAPRRREGSSDHAQSVTAPV